MTRIQQGARRKYGFFAVLVVCIALVLWADEYVVFYPTDPYWIRIAPVRTALAFHGMLGIAAFLVATAQFSSRLRARQGVHKWLGRFYLGAVTASAPFAAWIGIHLGPRAVSVGQVFQASFWLLTAWAGWLCLRRRDLARHRLWMMRTYGFCLVFVASRVPDAIPDFHWNEQVLADYLWALTSAALIGPDLVLLAANHKPVYGRASARPQSAEHLSGARLGSALPEPPCDIEGADGAFRNCADEIQPALIDA